MPISDQEVKEALIRASLDQTAEKEATLTEHMTVSDPSNEALEEQKHAIVVGGILILRAVLAADKAYGLSARRRLRNAKGPAALAAALGHMEEGKAVGDEKRGEESDKVKY